MQFDELIQEATTSETKVYNKAQALFLELGLDARAPGLARTSRIRHIRINNNAEEIVRLFTEKGIGINFDDAPTLSGMYAQSFTATFPTDYEDLDLAGQEVIGLVALRQNSKVGIKALTPKNLGLAGKTLNKKELGQYLKNNLPTQIQDEALQEFLLQLVEVALGEQEAVDSSVMDFIDPNDVRQTGVDFGEILTPLMLASDSESIDFPPGNEMLADVIIAGMPVSVKSASGSGTSFKAIKEYMDKFRDEAEAGTIEMDADDERVHKFFRAFVDTEGKNVDKIIAGSEQADTPEHKSMSLVIGKDSFTFQDLIEYSETFNDYGDFLKAVYPISMSGNDDQAENYKPRGMPADHKFYMGLTEIKPKAKQAGKPSWDASKGTAGANIMTYILGTGFLADAKTIDKKDKYNNMIKNILQNARAELAKIDITPDGKIIVSRKPFSSLDYEFQYHAPSHMAGNNLPGFSAILH